MEHLNRKGLLKSVQEQPGQFFKISIVHVTKLFPENLLRNKQNKSFIYSERRKEIVKSYKMWRYDKDRNVKKKKLKNLIYFKPSQN